MEGRWKKESGKDWKWAVAWSGEKGSSRAINYFVQNARLMARIRPAAPEFGYLNRLTWLIAWYL